MFSHAAYIAAPDETGLLEVRRFSSCHGVIRTETCAEDIHRTEKGRQRQSTSYVFKEETKPWQLRKK